MATIPSPRTWANGEQVTAAKLNTDVRDGFGFLLATPHAILRMTAAQSISDSVLAPLAWNSEDLDTDGGHSTVTNNSRYTAQTAGWYYLVCNIRWSDTNNVGGREFWFRKNGNGALRQSRSDDYSNVGFTNAEMQATTTSGHMFLAVNDYVEVEVFQNSGITMSVENDALLDIRWVRT